jgi:trk system potassium uptake protein TrkA
MRALLAGDSKQSWNIISQLLDKHHHITVINKDITYCQKLADQYEEIGILNGDSTELTTLEEADAKEMAMVIAMSPDDSENFVICKLCENIFHIQNTAAIINCPRNTEIFRKLGITTVVDTSAYILSCIQ